MAAVAFDAATSVKEENGDGVVSLTHTASGANRAAFAGVGSTTGGSTTSTSVTYNAVAMTELWDFVQSSTILNAGYVSASEPPTGAQTVTSTLASLPASQDHLFGVITMTGVDQTTPVGTAATAGGTTSPATVTVGSVGVDDLVVDNLATSQGDDVAPVVGADQTSQWSQDGNFTGSFGNGSTQPGTAGGVMSWTFNNRTWAIGAVAFKPIAGGGAPAPPIPASPMQSNLRW